jgi:hypothetical protein
LVTAVTYLKSCKFVHIFPNPQNNEQSINVNDNRQIFFKKTKQILGYLQTAMKLDLFCFVFNVVRYQNTRVKEGKMYICIFM